jgi:hypothetical protein
MLFGIVLITAGTTNAFEVVSLTQNQFYDFETNDTNMALNSSMDVKCTTVISGAGNQGLTPVNSARRAVNVTTGDYVFPHAINYIWNQNEFQWRLTSYWLIVTNQGNYVRMLSQNAQNNLCQFTRPNTGGNGVAGGNLSSTPFFDGAINSWNFTALNEPFTFQTNDTLGTQFSTIDLGHSYSNATNYLSFNPANLLRNMNGFYDSYYNVFRIFNGSVDLGTSCPSNTCSPNYGNGEIEQLRYLTCASIADVNFTAPYNVSNLYVGQNNQYDYTCWNNDRFGPVGTGVGFSINESLTDKGDNFSVYRDIRLNAMFYNYSSYFIISAVQHSPTNPQEGQTVTVSWLTSLPTDSTVFYRYRNASDIDNDSSYVTWLNANVSALVTAHSVPINGSNILDGKYYQYFVVSNGVNDTNNGLYYNFTVGAVGTSINPDSSLNEAINRLSESGLCSGSSCVYLFLGLPILIIFTLVAWFYIGSTFGKAVFLILLTVESLTNLLPIFLVLPVILITAFYVARQFGSLGGGDG